MSKKSFLLLLLVFAIKSLLAGDTIRVMQYNLLYYDKTTDFCTISNNDVNRKNVYLQTITAHYAPDIFTVNEMNGSAQSTDKILNSVLNQNDINSYKRANYTGSYLVNMLYYNSAKLVLQSQSYILTSPRLTDVYRLYYKSNDLMNSDTVFITCIVTHLKAGSYDDNPLVRKQEAEQIMNYINNRSITGNILLMGDFNVYSASEQAFQRFLTPTATGIQLNDPIDQVGDWNNNSQYAKYHTQSTHTSGDCYSSGGMDDRFDFILASDAIMGGTAGARYVEDSYWAYGQDGKRFNSTLVSPSNTSLPEEVIDALYLMSDHIPVTLKLYVDTDLLSTPSIEKNKKGNFRVVNPINDIVAVWSLGNKPEEVELEIVSQQGSILYKEHITFYPNVKQSINAAALTSGFYIIRIKGLDYLYSAKIVKQ